MTSWQKKAVWTAGAFGLASIAYAVVLPALFDGEQIKKLAHEKVQETWSRKLSIGDLSLRLQPFPELHAENVSLTNPSWAKNQHLLHASSVSARLELLPLLRRKVRIKSISIDGFSAHLELSPDGKRKSWELNTGNPVQNPSAEQTTSLDFQSLRNLRIRNADISYPGRQKKISVWHIDDISGKAQAGFRDVRIDARLSRNKHPVHIEAKFEDLSRFGKKGATSEGSVDLRWDSSHLKIAGKVPLEASLQGNHLQVDFTSKSFADILGFIGIESRKTAPLNASAMLIESQGRINAIDLKVGLGKLTMSGDAQLKLPVSKPAITARLVAGHVDWPQALLDAGRPAPSQAPDELFPTHPLAWKSLLAFHGMQGLADVKVESLKLRSGITLKNAKAKLNLKGDRLNVTAFSADLLGGSMSGNMQLNGSRKSVRLNLDASDVSLAQWFAERGKTAGLSGGPMKIKASVSASGTSMKNLAASLTGPVSISVGPAVITSQMAGAAETLLTGMFSVSDTGRINLQCASAQLPFESGRATAKPIVGVRSDTSQLLTSGFIDLQKQTLDLRGRVRAVSGVSLGVAMMAGDVKIAGKLLRPEVGLDPSGAPEVLARLGAAFATGGISILGTTIWDAANTRGDPCAVVLAKKKPSG